MTSTAKQTVTGIAVNPGRARSVHLTELPLPTLSPDLVLVQTRRVGICGTDKEIIDGHFGVAPKGADELVIGHEVLGQVVAAGEPANGFAPGDLVVATVRRPDGCPACQAGQPDMCLWRQYTERGIIGANGFMIEQFVEHGQYLIPVQPSLEPTAVLLEPLTVVEKALRQARIIQRRIVDWQPRTALILGAGPIGLLGTLVLRAEGIDVVTVARTPAPNPAAAFVAAAGAHYVATKETSLDEIAASLDNIDLIFECTGQSGPVFDAMRLLGNNGVLVLISITGGNSSATISADVINREMVLGNKVVVGSVNAGHEDFLSGVEHLGAFERRWPGLTEQLITHRLRGFDDYRQIRDASVGGIKAVIEID